MLIIYRNTNRKEKILEMRLSKSIDKNYELIASKLKIKDSFDIIAREIYVGGKKSYLFFVDGLVKDDVTERILNTIMNIPKEEMNAIQNINTFMNKYIAHIEVDKEDDIDKIVTSVLVGPMAIVIDGFEECMLLDVRTYPARGPEEAQNEQTLKGPKDGFVETIVMNTALVRRRVRDENLIFEMLNIGNMSKTDVSIGYIKGVADESKIEKIKKS